MTLTDTTAKNAVGTMIGASAVPMFTSSSAGSVMMISRPPRRR